MDSNLYRPAALERLNGGHVWGATLILQPRWLAPARWIIVMICVALLASAWLIRVDAHVTGRGRVVTRGRSQLTLETSGVISSVAVRRGGIVQQGDLLLSYRPVSARSDVLARADLVSPIAGVVEVVVAHVGELMPSGATAIQLRAVDSQRILVTVVPRTDRSKLRRGLPLSFRTELGTVFQSLKIDEVVDNSLTTQDALAYAGDKGESIDNAGVTILMSTVEETTTVEHPNDEYEQLTGVSDISTGSERLVFCLFPVLRKL